MLKKILIVFLVVAFVVIPACNKNTNEPNTKETTTQTDKTPTDPEPAPTELKIRVATYNVKHFTLTNHSFDEFAKEIKKAKVEIIGLQEVDYCTSRSNGLNEAKHLAEELGWYYKFAPALSIKGGKFGHAILSKYPIESFKTVPLRFQTGFESRSLGHAVINVNGYKLNFLNTHLCHENDENRIMQFEDIAAYVKDLDNFMITGDFNTNNYSLFSVIENAKLLNGDPIEYPTFPKKGTGIDNIVYSLNFKFALPRMNSSDISDHRMFYVDVTIPLE